MIVLDIIPSDSVLWPQTFYHILKSYRGKMKYYGQEIRQLLAEKSYKEIVNDVDRALSWFERLINDLNIPKNLLEGAKEVLVRIIVITIKESPQYQYLQGYDRFAAISYALSLRFVLKFGLGQLEAEAFAVSLFRKLITINTTASYLERGTNVMRYFSNIDGYLRSHNFNIINLLEKINCGSVDFASNWAGVFFADSHNPLSFLLIWDEIVLHSNKFDELFCALVSAHLNQIEIEDDSPYSLLQNIQMKNDWNVYKIIQDTRNLLLKPIFSRNSLTGFTGFWI